MNEIVIPGNIQASKIFILKNFLVKILNEFPLFFFLQSNEQLNANNQYILTQAGLEEYSRSYYDQNVIFNHQKQSSYAQSEGYHSYVSSSDSTSTPFLDR